MTRMWRGPCEGLKAAENDPLWVAIHRRGGRHLVSCNVALDGRSADFFRLEKIGGAWHRRDLGSVGGRDPFSTALAGYRRFTPFDADLVRQNHAYIERMAEEISFQCSTAIDKLAAAVDAFCE